MHAHTFDRLVADVARRPSRRTALRLLSAGLLAVLLPTRVARAQRPDRDGDGLFDDDEVNVYGTNPDDWDTDDDGVADGEEIYNRDQGLGGNTDQLVNENAAPPPADPAPAATCTAVGRPCAAHRDCCGYDTPYYSCCFNADGLGTCTDMVAEQFTCPDPGVPSTGCAVGLTNCGGFCTDLSIDHGNCGACGHSCPFRFNCTTGTCLEACSGGLVNCGTGCVNLENDFYNCARCGRVCTELKGGYCEGGLCHYPND